MNIEGVMGLFPLSRINAQLTHYYVDATGNVYSTKQTPTPKKMLGTSTSGYRYYNLRSARGGAINERADLLMYKCRQHSDWKRETNLSTEPGILEEVASQMDTKRAIGAKGYVICQVQGDQLVFGSKPKIHPTLISVKAEVERLANKSPGVQIVYLQILGSAIAGSLVWV